MRKIRDTSCVITENADGNTFSLQSPYDPNLVADLKVKIPQKNRSWDPVMKLWIIDLEYIGDVIDMCEVYFGKVDVRDE